MRPAEFLSRLRSTPARSALAIIATLYPLNAWGLPFDPTPEGFLGYLNSISNWDSGAAYRFIKANPQKCRLGKNINYMPHIDGIEPSSGSSYSCDVDYVETTSLGERTCINAFANYNLMTNNAIDVRSMGSTECSEWRSVASQEPQNAPIPPPHTRTRTASRRDSIIIKHKDALIIGAIPLAMGLLAFGIGKTISNKDDQ
jgi:hypothetical protein